jgi:menaquinone-dependent protoporphyrinogen oxidase
MKLLIVYGTVEGQTRKICEYLRDEAKRAGHTVSLNDTTETHLHPEAFDAVIVGSSVHAEKYQDSVEHYVQEHHEVLNKIPGAFVSVSLTAASDEPKSWNELEEMTKKFLDRTGWHPEYVEQVAGALRYSKYNFLKKFIMRMIAQKQGGDVDTSQDYEYTDWDQVKRILKKLEKSVPEPTKVKK